MELEDVRSALIKLYGLLQRSEQSLLSASSVNPSGEQSLAGAIDKILEDVGYTSKQVADAIKRIKSRLQALPPPAEVVDPLNEKNPAHKGSCGKASSISIADKLHPPVETKEQMVTRSDLSQAGGGSVLSGNVLSNRKISQGLHTFNDSGPPNNVVSQSQKPILVASDLQSQAASQEPLRKSNDLLRNQKNGKEYKTQQKDQYQTIATLESELATLREENQSLSAKLHEKQVTQQESTIEQPTLYNYPTEGKKKPSLARNCVGGLRVSPSQAKLGHASTFIAKMNPTRARALNRKDTLLDCNSSKIMVQPPLYDEWTEDQKVRGIHKNIHLGPQSRIVQRQQISEGTSSSFSSSSSRTSQQTNTSCNESESESQEYLPPRRRGSQLSGSASRRPGRFVSFSSSGESNSLHGRGSSYPKKEFRTEGRRNPEKQTGRLRRLKNKLGLVFNHHHHHHHHHHNHNNGDDSDHAEAAHAMSLWTHMGKKIIHRSKQKKVYDDHSLKKSRKKAVVSNVPSKNDSDHTEAAHAMSVWTHMRKKIIHCSNKKKVYDDHSVKKSWKKAVISNVPIKNQGRQFHSLVEGLMRQVRHSKKSKHSKGGIGRLGKDQHDHNTKVVKTSKKPQLRGIKLR